MGEFDLKKIRAPRGVERVDELLHAAVERLSIEYAAARDLDLAAAVVEKILPAGTFWIYGAGSHTAALLDRMGPSAGNRVRGIIDARPQGREKFANLPVVSLEEFGAAGDQSGILVAHPSRETEMLASLASVGVAHAGVRPLYQHPIYIAEATRLRPAIPERAVDAMILGDSRLTLASEDHLAGLFDPDTTPYVVFEWHAIGKPRPPFRLIDTHRSLDHVVALLRKYRPRTVYLRTFIPTNFLAYLVRQALPDCVLIHELWDLTVLLEDKALWDLLFLQPEVVEIARLSEIWSARHSDMMLTKHGGRQWATFGRDGTAPAEFYFTQVDETPVRPPVAQSSNRKPRIAYAGIMPRLEELPLATYDYHFVPLMQQAAEAGDAEIVIFNSAHDQGEAPGFEGHADYFKARSIGYQRRLPYAELMERLQDFDYGWLALPPGDEWELCKPVIVPARFTGYVNAGLPILINEPWSFCVDLVREFDAGIVLEEYSLAGLRAALAAADPVRHRRGVAALKAHMLAENGALMRRMSGLSARSTV